MATTTNPQMTGVQGALSRNPLNNLGLPYAPWMSDTFSGLDIYDLGFGLTPTVFCDPSNTSSLRTGSYKNPFTTAADLNAWINSINQGGAANLAGQTLGFRRGTVLLGGWTTPNAGVYGASGDPFSIVPYGDALAMPVISAGKVYANTGDLLTGWETTSGDTGGSALVWKLFLPSEADVFDQSWGATVKRLWKVSNSGITSEAEAIAALLAQPAAPGPGWSLYYNQVLFIYPVSATPNFGMIEVMSAASALQITYADVATTCNITVAGLSIRGGTGVPFYLLPAGVTTNPTIENFTEVGCQVGQGGIDTVTPNGLDSHAVTLYGGEDGAHPMSNLQVIGNQHYDSLNGTGAYGGIGSGDIRCNQLLSSTGATVELWFAASNLKVHDNYAYGAYGLHQPLNGQYGNQGIWSPANATNAGLTTNSNSSANLSYYRNVFLNLNNQAIKHVGASGVCVNNLFQCNNGAPNTSPLIWLEDDATSHTSALEVSNNLVLGFNETGNGGNYITQAANTTLTSQTNDFYSLSGGNLVLQTKNQTYVYSNGTFATGIANPTVAPTTGVATVSNSLTASSYYLRYVWTNSTGGGTGTTLVSPEVNQAVTAGSTVPTMTPPTAPANVTGFDVYASTSSGTETLQASGLAVGSTWTMPATGLVAGANMPSVNTTSYNMELGDSSVSVNPQLASDNMTPTNTALFNAGTPNALGQRDWLGRPMLQGTDTKPAIGAVARPA